jgi:CubicO group peptidase (beta-lactamase class C family)
LISTFKAQRAYTWADDGYPITETTHLMRVASLSKMFTAACIQRLYDDKALSESTKVFAKLGTTKKALNSQTIDDRVNDITVEHLVDHEGGWDSTTAGDYVFKMRQIAKELGLSGPATKFDLIRYVYGEPLQFKPGSKSQYSNIGYTTLAYLVEKVTGKNYETYLRNTILQPDGVTAVRLARTLRSQRLANEVFYDDPNIGWSAAEPTKEKRTARPWERQSTMAACSATRIGSCCKGSTTTPAPRRIRVVSRAAAAAMSRQSGIRA